MGRAGGAQSAHRLRTPVQTIPACEEDDYGTGQLGKVGGFSLHGGGLPSGVAMNTRERKKLGRICRYISRPALSEARLELTEQGMVSYVGAAFRLNTAYLRGPIGMGLRMWYSSGAAFRRWIGTRSLHGPTGSAGAQTPNEPNTISWSTVTGRTGRPRLPSNSRYRESVMPLTARQVKPATADVEADGQ